ncbi:hypothetical protein IZ6_21720 [Terrihabitans soli]|uniref:Uncharacterized protein n=1 Tax=Terrihabitans soli TaxID=708113 RepID=A0A6S6QU23_9HYPH|nr:hypothetical protein [Terrihabitans soli]BCJ91437.1 hypothetical protein IZ6_21720 [Terrihabitans soli]
MAKTGLLLAILFAAPLMASETYAQVSVPMSAGKQIINMRQARCVERAREVLVSFPAGEIQVHGDFLFGVRRREGTIMIYCLPVNANQTQLIVITGATVDSTRLREDVQRRIAQGQP